MHPAFGLVIVAGAVLLAWPKKRREDDGAPLFAQRVRLPGAPIDLPCPTSAELDAWKQAEGVVVHTVRRAADAPAALDPGVDEGRVAYYAVAECRWVWWQDNRRAVGLEPFDDFFHWKYGPGWADEVRAGRVPPVKFGGP